MKIKIYNRFINKIQIKGEYKNIKECVEVNLTEADLTRADLRGVKNKKIIQIKGSKDEIISIDNQIQIGCEIHSIKFWLKNYKDIGEKANYTEEEIKEYFEYIKICENFFKIS